MLKDASKDSRELTTRQKIGQNIAARRNVCGLSQGQLGIAIGRDKDFIQRLEYGRCGLVLEEAWAIARVLRMADVFLLMGSQHPFQN